MFIIRQAKISDVRRLSYLIRNNIERVKDNLFTPIQHTTWSAHNKSKAIKERFIKRKIFCAFEHNKLVGTIAIEGNLVCGMYVGYSQRGKGVGQKLMNYLENYAQKKGIKELILTASPNGYGFYLKNGYKPYGAITLIFDGIKYPETKMKKSIPKAKQDNDNSENILDISGNFKTKSNLQKFMIVELFDKNKIKELYQRFDKNGRMLPDGVTYIDSWIDENVNVCYQLMESESIEKLNEWVSYWSDLAEFEIIPIISSQKAKQKILSK